ncbi:glycerophosphodiester phosphodiesterase family protein [Angustibacter luteus]|uniref:Glycerophosphodiester phosphodiesterase family protein n=1 Tax=Angustibacter luteus TaxID=658456 RepID=A0ABW1JJI7_9ACTN
MIRTPAVRVVLAAPLAAAAFLMSSVGPGAGALRADATPSPSVAGLPAVVWGAHRAGALEAPDGTLAAGRAQLAGGVATVLDADVRLLADGTPVIMHDATVDRTTTGHGSVSAMTAPQWAALRTDPAAWFGAGWPVERPPTLAQWLDAFGGRTVLLLEVKQSPAVDAVERLVRARGLVDSVILQSNTPSVVRQIADRGLHAQLWRTADQLAADPADTWRDSHAEQVEVAPASAPAQIRRLASLGRPVWAFAVNDRAQAQRLAGLGVTGFVSDDPAYVSGAAAGYPRRPVLATVSSTTAQAGDRFAATVTTRVPATNYLAPTTPVTVRFGGRGVRLTTAVSGVRRATLAAPAAPGRYRVDVVTGPVTAGETRTAGATRRSAATLVVHPEDAQLVARPRTLRRGGTYRVGASVRDSASSAYTGPRRERGGTVLGLAHARVRVQVRAGTSTHGRIVLDRTVTAVDDGLRANGIGSALTGWSVPRSLPRGRYTLRVLDGGGWYDAAPSCAPIWVR